MKKNFIYIWTMVGVMILTGGFTCQKKYPVAPAGEEASPAQSDAETKEKGAVDAPSKDK